MKKVFLTLSVIIISTIIGISQTYKLYQTENIYTQLKLNTKTGEIYQIQTNDGQKYLINEGLTTDNEKENRYSLHKTKNFWTFILVDKFFGKLYQIQFSNKDDIPRKFWVINPNSLSTTETNKFSIIPQKSIFKYSLINSEDGEMWEFQWSMKDDEFRWIKKL